MKYIPSIAFEEMSGSAKGVTAAKVKNRKYIRNRGYGGSVRTSDQAKVKGVFKRLTTMWRGLTNEQILAWNKLALSQEARSVLGTKGKTIHFIEAKCFSKGVTPLSFIKILSKIILVLTKKISHNLKVQDSFIWWEF